MAFLGTFFCSGENLCDSLPEPFEDLVKVDTLSVAEAIADTIAVGAEREMVNDSIFATYPWWKQLLENGFRIHDPRVNYPKFPRFCLKVYDWGDKTFNSYNPEYVVGVGKNWKVMLKNYNWMTTYMMFFEHHHSLHIRSDILPDVGAYVCFMAVSLGYSAKLDNLIGHGRKTRENLNFSFTSSLFTATFNFWETHGGTKITRFGEYNNGHSFTYDFDAVRLRSYQAEAYYFFNHLKFSHAAAYCFSKYQLKSAGSWVAGFSFNHQTLDMDFSSLPADMKAEIPSLDDYYRFRFNDYDLMGGYAHNWVIHPRRWLINLTVLPSVGFRYSYRDSSEGQRNLFSTNLRAHFAVVYNHKGLFASLNGRFDGHVYYNSRYTLFDSIESLSLNVGARF